MLIAQTSDVWRAYHDKIIRVRHKNTVCYSFILCVLSLSGIESLFLLVMRFEIHTRLFTKDSIKQLEFSVITNVFKSLPPNEPLNLYKYFFCGAVVKIRVLNRVNLCLNTEVVPQLR